VIVTPYAELIHRETTTRSLRVSFREERLFQERWRHITSLIPEETEAM
jgi:hypothetical protein